MMRAVRHSGTAAELIVREKLREVGLQFRCNVRTLPGAPDIVIDSASMVILVHGCFWHGHTACRKGRTRPKSNAVFWEEKIARNVRRDARVRKGLRLAGWRVFTVWECEATKVGLPHRLRRALQGGTRLSTDVGA
jgi:DNA mismatch endonuclease (patch repair protein)